VIDKSTPGVWVYPDRREVIQTKTLAGRTLMEQRRFKAWDESRGVCCLCDKAVHIWCATLEHKTAKGSGGSKHDDRQSNLGISHFAGNVRRGSMSLENYMQFSLEERIAFCQGTVPPKWMIAKCRGAVATAERKP